MLKRTAVCLACSVVVLGACGKKEEATPVAAADAVVAAAPAYDDEKVLNIYNWPDYAAESLIPDFEKETGIKVNYQTFENNEVLQAKLVAGNTGFDIVVPGAVFIGSQIQAGFYQPLDKTALKNYDNLDSKIIAKLAEVDPGHKVVIPWAWSYSTVGINRTKVEKALAGMPMPENAWDLVLKPEYTSKLKSCGIAYLDSPTEILPVVLHYVGKRAYSNDPADYKLAAAQLAKVRKDVRIFSSTMIDDVASGRVCAALGWAGDFQIAAARAKDNGSSDAIDILLPSTGGLIFFDVMAITKDAKHPKNAHAFMDFYLRPDQSAKQTNEMHYMTANKAAEELMNDAVKNNKSLHVDAESMAKMVPPAGLSNEAREAMSSIYTAFKKGK